MSVLSGLFFWLLMLALPTTRAPRPRPVAVPRLAVVATSSSSSGGAAAPPATAKATAPSMSTGSAGSGAASSTGARPRIEPTRVVPEPTVDPAAPPTYSRDVAPLFELRCVRCHGSPFARNDLRLTSYADAMRGGETGTAIIPADPEGSLLLKKIEGRDKPSMPPRRPLSKAEKLLLRKWITAGAPP